MYFSIINVTKTVNTVVTVVFTTFVYIQSIKSTLTNRIVGGTVVTNFSYPFLVSLQTRSFEHNCAGSLITLDYVLTAAHCLMSVEINNPQDFIVVGGTVHLNFNIEMRRPKTFYVHENFVVFPNSLHDIGLILLETPFVASDRIGIVHYDFTDSQLDSYISQKQNCIVMGWGRSLPRARYNPLKKIEIPLISTNECQRMLPYAVITDQQICAISRLGTEDACQGDSGGPLLCNDILVGIVSWGIGCARKDSPGVYTKVQSYRTWIDRTIDDLNFTHYLKSSECLKKHFLWLWLSIFNYILLR